MDRDERAIVTGAMERAGRAFTLDEARGFPAAMFDDEGLAFQVDAPSAWLRVATATPSAAPSLEVRRAAGLLYTRTGLAHVRHDAERGAFRIAASIQAVDRPPRADAVRAAIANVAAVARALRSGEGDVRAIVDPASGGDAEPSLADAARALGKALAIVPEKDGSFVGGLEEPRSGVTCGLRVHAALPGVFAFDAWRLPPARASVDAAMIERLERFGATLDAGAMLLSPDGLLVHRWACPLRLLDLEQLETPVIAHVALDAFVRLAR